MIHARAPHFLWPFAVRYAAHQLNLWPYVSLPETSPTLHWTGEVGDASVFWVWGSHAFVRDTSADKLSTRAIPCVFLGFVPDASGWQFYHPTSRCVLPSQDVTFDESVPFYHLFPYRSNPPPPPPLFLASAVGSDADRGAASGGAASRGAEPGGAESEGAGSEGAELGGEEPGGAEPVSVEPRGADLEGAESGGAEPRGASLSGGPAAALSRLSPQQLRTGDAGAGGPGVTAGAGGTRGIAAAGPGGARTRGTGAARTGGVGGAGAGDSTELGAVGTGGSGAGGAGAGRAGVGGTSAGGAGAEGAGVGGTGAGRAGAAGAGAVDPRDGCAGGTVRPRPYFVPCFSVFLVSPSPLPSPSPYTKQSGGLTKRASRPVSPVRTACRAPRLRPPPVPGTHAMALRPSPVPLRFPLPPPPESSLPECAGPLSVGGECALGTDILEDRQEDFECLAATVPRFASMLLAPEGDPDAPDIPTPHSYYSFLAGQPARGDLAAPPTWLHWVVSCRYPVEAPPASLRSPPGDSRVARHTEDYTCGSWVAPPTADPSLFLRTDTTLPPFYVLVYADDLVFATADTEAPTLVKSPRTEHGAPSH
ncbi:unnamed protein product [Closterium sp. NIES-53]